jgi:hypothetical protein
VERLETRDLPASILGGPGVLLPTMPVHVDTEQANHVASVWNSVNNHVTTSITVAETVYQWGAPATHERVVIVEFITLTVTIRSVSPVVRLEREDGPELVTTEATESPAVDLRAAVREAVHAEARETTAADVAQATLPARPPTPVTDGLPTVSPPVNGLPFSTLPTPALFDPARNSIANPVLILAAAPTPTNPRIVIVGSNSEPTIAGDREALPAWVPGPAEVVAGRVAATGSNSGDTNAMPWLAGIVTPALPCVVIEPFQALRGAVDEAQGFGQALLEKVMALATSPWLAAAFGMVAVGALVRRRTRRRASACDVPEITAPRQLT